MIQSLNISDSRRMPGRNTSIISTSRKKELSKLNGGNLSSVHPVTKTRNKSMGLIRAPAAAPTLHNVKLWYDDFGSAGRIQIIGYVDTVTPKSLRPLDALIQVEASTVCRMDCELRRNQSIFARRQAKSQQQQLQQEQQPHQERHQPALPISPGCDLVGRVLYCGEQVHNFGLAAGDRVVAIDLSLGGNSRYVKTDCRNLIKIPSDVDATEVAAILRTYMAAHQCLFRAGGARPAKSLGHVLVTGGNGCVGRAVIQLALLGGATTVYATSRKQHKPLLESLGATYLSSENPRTWAPCFEGQMDIVVDCLSSSDGYQVTRQLVKERTGKLVCLGCVSELQNVSLDLPVDTLQHQDLAKTQMSQTAWYDLFESLDSSPMEFQSDLSHLIKLLQQKKISPSIAYNIRLDDVAAAHQLIEDRGVSGHIICLPFATEETSNVSLLESMVVLPNEHCLGMTISSSVLAEEGDDDDDDDEEDAETNVKEVRPLHKTSTTTGTIDDDQSEDDENEKDDTLGVLRTFPRNKFQWSSENFKLAMSTLSSREPTNGSTGNNNRRSSNGGSRVALLDFEDEDDLTSSISTNPDDRGRLDDEEKTDTPWWDFRYPQAQIVPYMATSDAEFRELYNLQAQRRKESIRKVKRRMMSFGRPVVASRVSTGRKKLSWRLKL